MRCPLRPACGLRRRTVVERLNEEALTLGAICEVTQEEHRRGDFDPDAREVRLDVFHNYFAAPPRLPRGVFAGTLDREFDLDGTTYTEIARGERYGKEPETRPIPHAPPCHRYAMDKGRDVSS